MANAAESARWNHTASMLCMLRNLFRGQNASPMTVAEFHPNNLRKSNGHKHHTTPTKLRTLGSAFGNSLKVVTISPPTP